MTPTTSQLESPGQTKNGAAREDKKPSLREEPRRPAVTKPILAAAPAVDGRAEKAPPKKAEKKRQWAPRLWEGMNFVAWVRLMGRNRCAVHFTYLYIAIIVTVVSIVHSLLRLIQEILLRGQIRRTEIRHPPIFILGHWRTGTTLLHEFLIQDERHNYPTYYECQDPNHFLLTEKFMTRFVRFLMPTRRPMDNMAVGWDHPQEDEFALCMLGQPSPYLKIAFPNRPPMDGEALDLDSLAPRLRQGWQRAFLNFIRQLTYKNPRRLILKSPPHTCRIKHLLRLFPNAKFVHIVRNPYVVFPSTVHLWKSLYRAHGLQRPHFAGLEEQVIQTFLHFEKRYSETKALIPAGNLHEMRYEDLTRDPVGQMQELYDQLQLGGFEALRPRLERYLATIAGYETNKYQLSDEQKKEIAARWGAAIQKQGYDGRL